MVEDKYIGLGLAIGGTVCIGSSFIITKKGLNDAAKRGYQGQKNACKQANCRHYSDHIVCGRRVGDGLFLFNSWLFWVLVVVWTADDLAYLKNPIWWTGMVTMIVGEVANFAAYTFAPAILVTPLGALSVIIGAILASILLDEKLGKLGVCGCASCLIGSVIIILHAPADPEVNSVDEILNYATQPGFLFYLACVAIFSTYMVYRVVPKYGPKDPMVYLSICSLVGSVSVMAIKAFGIALKLTIAGNNQLTHASTYLFGLTVLGCILVQMNYFNKALDTFSTNVVNPIYYVFFTTSTIIASAILFQGFNTTDAGKTVSLICGFLIIFMGVYLLNLSREPEQPKGGGHSALETGMMNPRMSMSGRLSNDVNSPLWAGGSGVTSYSADGSPLAAGHGRRSSLYRQQNNTLYSSFGEESIGLTDLAEADDESDEERTMGEVKKQEGRHHTDMDSPLR